MHAIFFKFINSLSTIFYSVLCDFVCENNVNVFNLLQKTQVFKTNIRNYTEHCRIVQLKLQLSPNNSQLLRYK